MLNCCAIVLPLFLSAREMKHTQVPEHGPGPDPTAPDPKRHVPVGKPERRNPGHHVAPHVQRSRVRLARALQQARGPAAQA